MMCCAGDLKGANVLMKSTSVYDDPRGFVCKISDFGLSRVLDQNCTHVSTSTYGG
jgi:serine/threonine protein kinase